MIITDNELNERLSSPDNLVNRLSFHRTRARTEEVPMEIKKVVAVLANEGCKQDDIAEEFGFSQPAVSHYANGKIGGVGKIHENEELKDVIAKVNLKRATVEDKAIDALLESISVMKPQLADVSKPKILSGIARDMAAVARDMSGRSKDNEDGNRNVHLHIYTPRMKDISEYETIEVNS